MTDYKTVCTEMALFIDQILGDCPAGLYDWCHPDGCENACSSVEHQCWLIFFGARVEEL